MAVYSKVQLEALWALENPGNGDPHLMAAIALAESAGRTDNVNSIGACGLWQIHPFEAGCENPRTNAKQAGAKLRSQGLGAWESYTNGSYKQFYTGKATTATAGLLGKLPGVGGFPNPFANKELGEEALGQKKLSDPTKELFGLGGLIKLIKFLSTKDGWVRVGKVLIGLFLLVIGTLGMGNINVVEPTMRIGTKAAELAAVV